MLHYCISIQQVTALKTWSSINVTTRIWHNIKGTTPTFFMDNKWKTNSISVRYWTPQEPVSRNCLAEPFPLYPLLCRRQLNYAPGESSGLGGWRAALPGVEISSLHKVNWKGTSGRKVKFSFSPQRCEGCWGGLCGFLVFRCSGLWSVVSYNNK